MLRTQQGVIDRLFQISIFLIVNLLLAPSAAHSETYLDQITVFSEGRITRFAQNPIQVFVLPPPGQYQGYVADLDDALEQWHLAAPDQLAFARVETPEEAQIQVRWATHSLNQTMDHALGDAKLVRDESGHHVEVTASLRDKRTGNLLTHEAMRTVCLHELGHALGLWGHSPDPGDIMYYAAEAQAPTLRDQATMRELYQTEMDALHHADAITVLTGWLEKTPDVPRFYYLLGSVYQDQGEYDLAADAFLKCLEIDLTYRAAGQRLVEVYKQLGRADDAMQQAEVLLQSDPTPETYNTVGGLYYQQGDLDRATECFRKALELDARYRPARHNLFALLRARTTQAIDAGEYALAIQIAEEALQIEPTDAHLYVLRGNAHASMQQHEEAIAAYQEALRLSPGNQVAKENLGRSYNNRGVSLVRAGRYREAIHQYEQAQQIRPEMKDIQTNIEDAYWKMAAKYVEQGRTEEGVAAYRELLERNPKLTEIRAIIGGIYFKQKSYALALASFRVALQANPEMPEARHNLLVTHIQYGQKLDRQRRYDEAIDQYKSATEIQPDYLDVYLLLAQSYRHANRIDDSLATLEKAVAFDPDNEEIQKSIANVHIQRGNQLMRANKNKAAIEAFEKIPTAQKNVGIYTTLAYLYLSSGQLMASLPALREAARLAPKDSVTYQNFLSLESQLVRKFDPRPGKEKPGTRDHLAIARAELTRCLLGRAEYTPAKDKYKEAFDSSPTSEGAKKVLLEVGSELLEKLQQIGWPKNAKEVAGWLLELDPEHAKAKALLSPSQG